ncbi:hypothetical protein EBU71_14075, partial [bacterium]|nr:hypothetical protein [Candidatus Elulimicrobium humile]
GKANWADLPTASAGTAGVIKVGSGLSIDGNGILSTTSGEVTGYLKQDGSTPLTGNWPAGNYTISCEKFNSSKDSTFHGISVGVGGNGSVLTNVAVGSGVLNANTSGLYNVAIGVSTLSSNTDGNLLNLSAGTHTICAQEIPSGVVICGVVTIQNANPISVTLTVDSTVSCLGNDGGLSAVVTGGTVNNQSYLTTWTNNVPVNSVYDLSVEYQDIGNTRRFYLYINNKLIKIVDDKDPLPIYNNMAVFVRGSSRCMFENVYAITQNYAQNTVATVGETLSSVFGDKQIDTNEAFRKYAIGGIIQSTYLSGISAQEPPKYNMYFEEFGSIMRECAYFDVRYDRAYPALYAKISPTFNRIKGYTVSGFQADSYGAEFLIFNATDTALNLDETTGNYLRIQGVTFTQDTTHELTVDEYFKKKSNLSDPEFEGDSITTSALVEKALYDEIKLSRLIYGKNEFAIDSIYIQSPDDAENILGWIINKTKDPKKAVGLELFAIPSLQLGDVVTITYQDKDGLDLVANSTTRFIVYNIDYSRSNTGSAMTVYLSEV